MDDLIYKVEKEKDIAVMALTLDNITMYQNEELKKAFTDILDKGAKKIILDLSKTDFISTLVIASMVYMLKRAKEAGGNLVICSVKGRIKDVLAMTNLDKIFDIFPDRPAAVAAFNKK